MNFKDILLYSPLLFLLFFIFILSTPDKNKQYSFRTKDHSCYFRTFYSFSTCKCFSEILKIQQILLLKATDVEGYSLHTIFHKNFLQCYKVVVNP